MGDPRFESVIRVMAEQRERHGVNLGGRLYSLVKDRVEMFRREFGDTYGIDTTVITDQGFSNGAPIVAVAKIIGRDGHVLASGWACEFVGSSDFTTYSPVEVAETSAIGRALACFGFHGGEYASANEIEKAQEAKRNFRADGPSNVQQFPRQEEVRPEPPQRQSSGLYVPDEDGQDPTDKEAQRVLAVVESINNLDMLARYWHELKPFMAFMIRTAPELAAEIKAQFGVANHELGGK